MMDSENVYRNGKCFGKNRIIKSANDNGEIY